MAKNIGIISGRVELDSVDFTKNLAAMKRELRTLKTDTELAKRGFDVFGDGVTGSAGVMKTFEDQIKVGANQMKRYSDDFNKAMKENDGQFTRASQNAQRNFKRMQLEVSKAAEEYYNYALQEERANNAMYQGAARMAETGDRWKKTGKSIEDFGQSWTKAGVAVGLGVAAVTKTAIDFESGVTEMAKTIDVSDEKFAQLTQGVRDLALEIPMAASELAQLASIAGQFGIHEDSILGFTETVAGLEVATDMTAESAAMMIAQFANITQMDHSNFDNLGSSIVELGNNLPTTEQAIMDMAQGLAGAGATAGMTQSEIIGLAGGLSSLGISSERGASSFSKLIVQMAVASATGVDAMASLESQTGMTRRELELMASNNSKGFKELADSLGMTTKEMNDTIKASISLEGYASTAGVTVEEFARIFSEDATQAIGMFVDGLAEGNDETGTAIEILDELGITEIRLRDTLLRTGNAQGLLNDAVKMSNDAWGENVALAEEADLFYSNTASQLTILKNNFKDVAIEVGTALLPVLNDFIDGLDPLINGIKGAATWFTNLDEGTQKLIASATGLFIIGGPIVSLIGKTVSGVGTLTGGAGKLAMKLLDVGNKSRAAKRTGEMLHRTLGDLIGEYGFGGLVTKLDAGVGGTDAFAGSMATAAGAKGAGAMTGALSALNPWLVGLVGAGGLLALGYGAWKLWGEEAWEAGQRTKKWGADVDEATADVLTDIQEVEGSFNLMQQGVSSDTSSMVENLQEIGETINNDINGRLEATENYLEGLPDVLKEAHAEILDGDRERLEETQELVVKNNDKINEIYSAAMEERGKLTQDELDYIRVLNNQTVDTWLQTLELSAEEEKSIRSALTGDIENITNEQAEIAFSALAKEQEGLNQARIARQNELDQMLENNEISKQAHGELSESWENYYKAIGTTSQRTMQDLAVVNEELVNSIDFATGRSIEHLDKTSVEYQAYVSNNKRLLSEWAQSHSQIGDEIVNTNSWIVDSATRGFQYWNDVVVESGGSVDVFREKLIESTQDATVWNNIRLQVHNAELDSNAKLIIGEAAIANGWWDGMAWEDKQAILKDNFSETVYKAIVDEGTWDKLSWEEQTAVLNNSFSDAVAQAIMDEDKWDDLPWEQKKAILTTNSPETLQQILEDIGVWNTLPINVRNLIVNNDQVYSAVNNAQRKINSLRGKSVTLRTVHESVYTSINRAGSSASSQRAAQSGYTFSYAQGTDYHKGGPAILGDGGRREPFLTPQGTFGISPATDTMYDMPRGTKVWSSIQNFTTQLKSGANKIADIQIPKFATGTIDFPNMQELLQPFRVPQQMFASNAQQNNVSTSGMEQTLNAILNALNNLGGGDINIDRIEVQDGSDLRRTMEEMNWIMQGEGNRLG